MLGIAELFEEYANVECDEYSFQFSVERRSEDIRAYYRNRMKQQRQRLSVKEYELARWRVYDKRRRATDAEYREERRRGTRERMRRLRSARKNALALKSTQGE